jgi:sirohydrochlorin cobaltochelatase
MMSDSEPKKECLVLIAHGSRDERWTLPFVKLAENLKKELGESRVYLAFMELSRPNLPEVSGKIFESGIRNFQLLPLFMSSGNHFVKDLPEEIEKVCAQYPGLKIELLPPIGENPEFFAFIHKIVREYID